MAVELSNTCAANYLLRTGRIDQLKNWRFGTLEDGRMGWMPIKESKEGLAAQQAEKPTIRFFENGGAERLTDKEYNRFKIARSALETVGMLDEHMRDLVARYFCRDSWSKI